MDTKGEQIEMFNFKLEKDLKMQQYDLEWGERTGRCVNVTK